MGWSASVIGLAAAAAVGRLARDLVAIRPPAIVAFPHAQLVAIATKINRTLGR